MTTEDNGPRNFKEDLENSNKKTIRDSWKIALKNLFGDCEIQWKDSEETQLGLGLDVTIKLQNTRRYSVELKGRRSDYLDNPNYLLELVHQRYKDSTKEVHLVKKEGWLYRSTANIIVIGTIINEEIVEACAFTIGFVK